MANISHVIIGIQARSTSSRLPNKGLRLMAGKPMTEWVIESCLQSANYLNVKQTMYDKLSVDVRLLVPKGDLLKSTVRGCVVREGDEHDVLSRYVDLMEDENPDFIVRVTGDCPLIPDHVISHMVSTSVKNSFDYMSNVDEDCRTDLDGIDCEVMSKRALAWLNTHAIEAKEREHVTLKLRRDPPPWARNAFSIGNFDFGNLKFSVDTEEDFKRAEAQILSRMEKRKTAEAKYGKRIYRH